MRIEFARCQPAKRYLTLRPSARFAAITLFLALVACGAPERNKILTTLDPDAGYRFHTVSHGSRDDTLVVMTMSGGGTRAAALATGALEGLHHAAFNDDARLDSEIDILSTVSGGTVAGAWYTLHGFDGLGAFKEGLLFHNLFGELLRTGANPVNLARLPTPSYSRIDWLIAALEKRLFKNNERYSLLVDSPAQRPFLIINAGDMTAETVFPFTQDRFDLICSDLASVKLSHAVAASAAFPVAFTAVTLTNFSPCIAQTNTWGANPPGWIINPVGSSPYTQVSSRRQALREWEYLNRRYPDDFENYGKSPGGKDWSRPLPKDERRQYIHLLDGGIADNLGLSEPLRLVTSNNSPAEMVGADGARKILPQAICEGDIRSIVFVVVNARSDRRSTLDQQATPPGILSMLFGATSSSIDGTTFGLLERLDTDLRSLITLRDGCSDDDLKSLTVHRVPVDFDYIGDPVCRHNFQNIETSWNLDEEVIEALIKVGSGLVSVGLTDAKSLDPREDRPRPSAVEPPKNTMVSAVERLNLTLKGPMRGTAAIEDACTTLAEHIASGNG